MKSKRFKTRYIFLIIIMLVGAGVLAAWISVNAGSVESEADIYVPTGAEYPVLLDSLQTHGTIRNMGRFRSTAKALGLEDKVKPGRYVLKEGMSYIEVVRMFQRGLQSPVRVTFNNVRTLPQLAGRIAAQLEPDSVGMLQTLTSPEMAARYGFDSQTFIAMFIPDTYELYWNTSPAGFIERMSREYDRFWNETRLRKLEDTGLTQVEAITLASIVYEETKMVDEMPSVAGLYINRLKRGIPLEADPTVKFALGDFGLRRVLFSHLEVQSPYNTYRNRGLPPGPICMPSVQAIDAVLNYNKHDYIFMCAKADFSGYHSFAVSNAEHNRNRQAYISALNARGIR